MGFRGHHVLMVYCHSAIRMSLLLIISLAIIVPCTLASQSINLSTSEQPDWKIDHAVMVVGDLNQSIEKFRNAGYTVIPGGEFPGAQTHNALIPFSDGSYIELFASVDPDMAVQMKNLVLTGSFDEAMKDLDLMDKRFMLHLADSPGVRDFAISADGVNLTEESVRVTSNGLNLSSPIAMTRTGEKGEVKWHVDLPMTKNQMAYPFLIADDTPRLYRVEEVNNSFHANGATGVKSLTVAVSDPSSVLPLYDSLLSGVSKNQTPEETTYLLNGSLVSIIKNPDIIQNDGPVNLELKEGNGETLSLKDLLI